MSIRHYGNNIGFQKGYIKYLSMIQTGLSEAACQILRLCAEIDVRVGIGLAQLMRRRENVSYDYRKSAGWGGDFTFGRLNLVIVRTLM